MALEDFWLRVYGLASDVHPEVTWNATLDRLLGEFHAFPPPTREALQGHLATMLVRLNDINSHLH